MKTKSDRSIFAGLKLHDYLSEMREKTLGPGWGRLHAEALAVKHGVSSATSQHAVNAGLVERKIGAPGMYRWVGETPVTDATIAKVRATIKKYGKELKERKMAKVMRKPVGRPKLPKQVIASSSLGATVEVIQPPATMTLPRLPLTLQDYDFHALVEELKRRGFKGEIIPLSSKIIL